MTDYFTHFSIGIQYKKKARKWLEEKLTYLTSEEYSQKAWDNGENNWNIEHTFDDDRGYLYLTDEDGAPDLDGLVGLLQEYLQKFDPDGFIHVTWADTCSKARVDEFGGGAAAITAKKVKYCNTFEFVASERDKHEGKKKTEEIVKNMKKAKGKK